MSLNARRRRPKIVAPQTPNREQELIGGLQNALSRGEDITKAKQSFISAGYKPEEIEAAAQKVSMIPKVIQQAPIQSTKPNQQSQQPTQTPQPQLTTTNPEQPKQASKKFLIILASVAALILIGAALLGLFWDKIF